MKTPVKDLDYVVLYAKKLKSNSSLFKQQKRLIESQMKSSREIFSKAFAGDFKLNARRYLQGIGLIN